MRQGQPGGDGLLVAADAAGEGVKCGLVTGLDGGEPVLEDEQLQALAGVIMPAKLRT